MIAFTAARTGAPVSFELRDVVLAGYTGRDQAAVRHHIDELAAHGVPVPERVPAFYRVTPGLVTTADEVAVLGAETSGEAELILLRADGELWIGVGSDHTDRALERTSVTNAKQASPKVVCPALWRHADVAGHWDALMLRAFADGDPSPYQEGPVSGLLEPEEILERVERRTGRGLDGVLVFSGTLGLSGELRFADRFAVELRDEDTGERLAVEYAVTAVDPLD